ncbi:MAG: sugar ABC transporter permease, partial [Oscillospiraceae bacterium]|nr:sugar ABC transporter permease [Oscillospiraceae bacterium]
LSIIGSLAYFDLVWIMTGGGPNGYSELMATYMFRRAFNTDTMGYASAVAGSMFIISMIVVLIFFRMTRSRDKE